MTPQPAPRRAAFLVFAATLAAYLVTAGGSLGTQDAVAVYFQTKSIVDRGAIDVPLEISGEKWLGVDGKYHLPFGIGQAIYNAPFYAVGKAVVRVSGLRVGGSDEPILKACVAMGSTLAAALTVAVTFLLAWRISGSISGALACALLLAFGTPLWLYGKFGFNAALTAAALTIGTYGLLVGRLTGRVAPYTWGALALAFGVLTRHEMAIAGFAALAWMAVVSRSEGQAGAWRSTDRLTCESPRRHAFAPLIVVGSILAAAVAAWMGLNVLRFGNPLDAGHSPAYGAVGFIGLLVSPAASLFVFAPIAFVGVLGVVVLCRERHPAGLLFAIVGAALFVFYASLEDWIGTRSYGPRYLVPLLPMLCASIPAGAAILTSRFRLGRAGYRAIVVLTVIVQVPAVAVNFVTVRGLASGPTANQVPFSWAASPLVLNTEALVPAVSANWDALRGRSPEQTASTGSAVLPGGSDLSSKLSFSFDFWWLYLFYLGKLSAMMAATVPLVLVAAAVWLFRLVGPTPRLAGPRRP